MAYNSFYGGRPGASFTIVKNFNTIEEMVENFKQGTNYKSVNYDEYVLISTKDRYSKDNGKIYRRGYDYTNDLGGAIYIGQISGAPGPAPYLELSTIEEVEETYETAGNQDIYIKGEGSYSVDGGNLVPGKYEENGEIKYNDEIKWAYCSFVEKDLGVAKIGFLTPYPVIDFEAQLVDTHYEGPLAERLDDGSHPYYSKWNISIPKGVKGESLNNLRVIKADLNIKNYEGQEDDVTNNRDILVYDYYNYDNNEDGNPMSIYLGDYNMIDGVEVTEEGTLIFSYTHDDSATMNKLFKWIKKVSLTENGHFTVEYNHSQDASGQSTIYETDLKWVNNIQMSEDGLVTLFYSTGEETVLNEKIKWMTNISIDTGAEEGDGTQRITISYNNNISETIGNPLNYIIKTAVTNDYHLVALHSDPEKRARIIAEGKNYTWDGRNDWQDLGSIKSEKGVMFGISYNTEDHPEMKDIAGAVRELNKMHPNGLLGEGLEGRVVTVGEEDIGKDIYAFDYGLNENGSYKGWYYLGTIDGMGGNNTNILVGKEGDSDTESFASALPPHGVWFIVE